MGEEVNQDQFVDTECKFCHHWRPKSIWSKIGMCLRLKKSKEDEEWCMFFKPDYPQYRSRMAKAHLFGGRFGKWRERYEDREV